MKFLANEPWLVQQFSDCALSDPRRNKRLMKVGGSMLACPEASIPQQNAQWSDTKAAYRLFDCPKVTFRKIAEVHWKLTRANSRQRCLLISDTTDIDHSFHHATTGLGMLGDGGGRGVQLHSCLVYSSQQEQVVGVAGALLNYRKRVPQNETRTQRLKRKRESQLWGDLVSEIGAPPVNTQWIHVFDRGGDNFEAMCNVSLNQCDWVIRAAKLQRNVILATGEKMQLKAAIEEANYLGSYELDLRSRPGVAARTMAIEVSSMEVTLPAPTLKSPWLKTCGIASIKMNVVVVRETNAPDGKKPIQWVLYTSLPANDFDQAWQIIEDYEQRWLIEEYHKALKTGCNVEGHALRTVDRLEALIGLISIIGIRLCQLKLIGRNQPTTQAKGNVPAKWLSCLQKYRPKLNTQAMTVYQFFRELAKLGGFLARKHDGEPGWQTIWRGYKKLTILIQGLQLANKKHI